MSKFQILSGLPAGEIRYVFHCPGCEYGHQVVTAGPKEPVWQWNGDVNSPTVSPSILVRSQRGNPPVNTVCHSFIKDGQIQFLGDCTHKLANQTVDIPDFEL